MDFLKQTTFMRYLKRVDRLITNVHEHSDSLLEIGPRRLCTKIDEFSINRRGAAILTQSIPRNHFTKSGLQ